jgi:hypothetical protein
LIDVVLRRAPGRRDKAIRITGIRGRQTLSASSIVPDAHRHAPRQRSIKPLKRFGQALANRHAAKLGMRLIREWLHGAASNASTLAPRV